MPELESHASDETDDTEQEQRREAAKPYAQELSNVTSLKSLVEYVRNGQR